MDRVRVRVMVGVMVRVTVMVMVGDTPWSTGCGKDCGHGRFLLGAGARSIDAHTN